jgi:hypothetical protein
VICNAHKPQILKGLPAVLASNPVGCGGLQRTEAAQPSVSLHSGSQAS